MKNIKGFTNQKIGKTFLLSLPLRLSVLLASFSYMIRKDKGREYFVVWVDKLKKYVYNIVESSFLRTNENIESSQKRTKKKKESSLLRTNHFLK